MGCLIGSGSDPANHLICALTCATATAHSSATAFAFALVPARVLTANGRIFAFISTSIAVALLSAHGHASGHASNHTCDRNLDSPAHAQAFSLIQTLCFRVVRLTSKHHLSTWVQQNTTSLKTYRWSFQVKGGRSKLKLKLPWGDRAPWILRRAFCTYKQSILQQTDHFRVFESGTTPLSCLEKLLAQSLPSRLLHSEGGHHVSWPTPSLYISSPDDPTSVITGFFVH